MGVRGFFTFLKNNEENLSTSLMLSDTNIVIDGNNLLCMLYASSCLDGNSPEWRNDIYGGDMVYYGRNVREFFSALQRCKIRPVVVFDGSAIGKASMKEFIVSKEKEIHRRGLDRFEIACNLSEVVSFNSDTLLHPRSLNAVFRNILKEFDVERVQTPYEADSHIARIANKLNCPVLTNDSDFIIYPLRRGFVMLDSFKYKRPICTKPGHYCIRGSLYSQVNLQRCVPGLRRENMPLLSILLGNDYVEQGTFDGIVEMFCSKPTYGCLEARTFAHRRIASLLYSMDSRSLQESINFILDSVRPTYRGHVDRCIKMLLRSYHIHQADDFLAELEESFPPGRLTDDPDKQPARFLRDLMEQDDLGSLGLDIIFHNTHYTYVTPDDLQLASSSGVSFRPISLALVLLRRQSYQNLTAQQRRVLAEEDSFHVFDRYNLDYTRLIVRPMEKLEKFGPLDHLDCYSMMMLDPALKRQILMETYRSTAPEVDLLNDTLSKILKGAHLQQACLCMVLVKYIGMESRMAPKPQYVNALTLTFVFYAALQGNLNTQAFPRDEYGPMLLKLRPLTTRAREQVDHSLFRRISHFSSQLQAAYKSYFLLNSLLDHPFHDPQLDKFLNSTLIFNITKLLRLNAMKLEELCGGLQILLDICGAIRVQVHCDA